MHIDIDMSFLREVLLLPPLPLFGGPVSLLTGLFDEQECRNSPGDIKAGIG